MAVHAFPNVGEKFASKYRIVSTLKTTESAVIFHAIEIAFDRDVTLKVIQDTDEEAFSNFRTRSQSFSKLNAPFTASVFSFGRSDGFLYLVLEYVEGEDLRFFQKPNPPATLEQVVNIFRQVLFSLREAHENGIIHGDLKAKNVMIVPTDESDLSIKIRDFQIVNFSGNVSDGIKTESTDIKALGKILLGLLAGHHENAPNIDLVSAPVPLKRIISKMLAEEQPYTTVDAVLADLGSPTLLDSMEPKTVSKSKIYGIGLAFGLFILAPLSWTSVQLLETLTPNTTAEVEPEQLKRANPAVKKPNKAPVINALKKASSSVTDAINIPTPKPQKVKVTTISKTKSKTKPVIRTSLVPQEEKSEQASSIVESEVTDVVPPAAKPKERTFAPNKFTARVAPTAPSKTEVEKPKAKSPKKKIKKAKLKTKPIQKVAPVSF